MFMKRAAVLRASLVGTSVLVEVVDIAADPL
jgi:hypothetical protein